MITPPPADPAELVDFPARTLTAAYPYARIYMEAHEPEWFCACSNHRFDPPSGFPPAFGTCYLAGHPIGAFIEKFGDLGTITRERIDENRLARLQVPGTRVADITDRRALGWHVTGALSAGDYPVAQQWAQRFYEAGFGGIWYTARHDPRSDLHSLALFGKPGVHPDAFVDTRSDPLDDDLVTEAATTFGLVVMPRSSL